MLIGGNWFTIGTEFLDLQAFIAQWILHQCPSLASHRVPLCICPWGDWGQDEVSCSMPCLLLLLRMIQCTPSHQDGHGQHGSCYQRKDEAGLNWMVVNLNKGHVEIKQMWLPRNSQRRIDWHYITCPLYKGYPYSRGSLNGGCVSIRRDSNT